MQPFVQAFSVLQDVYAVKSICANPRAADSWITWILQLALPARSKFEVLTCICAAFPRKPIWSPRLLDQSLDNQVQKLWLMEAITYGPYSANVLRIISRDAAILSPLSMPNGSNKCLQNILSHARLVFRLHAAACYKVALHTYTDVFQSQGVSAQP